ncbi:RsmB/NOP family class I SAM-dependent RNA methyltransferase [Promethearchaeum syntrophicum]|uniref:RsmB/NOP family class I SAM-dependent RNA methyltransferase n=1 Tax=Promethearchaeum syntrophicum TaxID=2594042 RepID=A0A5B9DBP7_9ARCH|nr:RsmB/NOP family class I SAM-dependent RNA methyltransferase [Candidatus Prometheoarchaeum syntrophicum]
MTLKPDKGRNMEEIYAYARNQFISSSIVDHIHNTITNLDELKEILESITIPPQFYFLRVNLNKISMKDLLKELNLEFPETISEQGPLENTLKIPFIENQTIPMLSKQIYTDKYAAESIMLGADLFVPGFCGTSDKFDKGEEISILLKPTSRTKKMDENVEKFHVANGETMISSKDLPKYRNGILVNTTLPKYSLPKYRSSSAYKEGWISEQTLPATIACAIFVEEIVKNTQIKNPIIFDVCSAPGHKTTAIAERSHWLYSEQKKEKWLKIVSIDRSTNRLEHLRNDIKRLRLHNIDVLPIKLERILNEMPELREKANYLLFDPPCSALGTRPKLYLEKSQNDLLDFPKNQRRLLKIVDQLVKPGGILMYNTCTIPKEENEGILAYAVQKLGYQTIPIDQKYLQYGTPGLDYDGLDTMDLKNLLRFYPRYQESSGYFIAILRKI